MKRASNQPADFSVGRRMGSGKSAQSNFVDRTGVLRDQWDALHGTIEGVGEAPPTLLMTKLPHEPSKWRLVGQRNELVPT